MYGGKRDLESLKAFVDSWPHRCREFRGIRGLGFKVQELRLVVLDSGSRGTSGFAGQHGVV